MWDNCVKTSCTAPLALGHLCKTSLDAGHRLIQQRENPSTPSTVSFLVSPCCSRELICDLLAESFVADGKRKDLWLVDISWRGFGANLRLFGRSRTSSAFDGLLAVLSVVFLALCEDSSAPAPTDRCPSITNRPSPLHCNASLPSSFLLLQLLPFHFPHFQPPRAPSLQPFSHHTIHTVTRSVYQTSRLDFPRRPGFTKVQGQRALPSAFTFQPPFCHHTPTHARLVASPLVLALALAALNCDILHLDCRHQQQLHLLLQH